jgi:hypothetical protein
MFGEEIGWQIIGHKVAALARFFRRAKFAAGDLAEECQHYLLLLRLGIDACQAFDFNLQTSFLSHLTAYRLIGRFAGLHPATGEIPPINVAAMCQENVPYLIENHCIDPDAKLGRTS